MIHASPLPPVEVPRTTLPELVLAQAARLGNKPALIDGVSGRTLTYAQLDELSGRIAAGLQARGLRPGDVVGILSPNVPEYAAAFLGVARAGCANTTINGLYTEGEIAQQLRSAGARALFTVSALLERALAAASSAGVETVISFDGGEGALALTELVIAAGEPEPVDIDPATAVVSLPYSSGTTGLPKGVRLTHRNMVANVVQLHATIPVAEHDVMAGVLPFFHIYGQTAVMNCTLRAGATIVTLPRFDLELFLGLIAQHGITRAYVAPPVVVALAKHPVVDGYDVSTLNMMLCGAAPLDEAIENAAAERLDTRIQQGYGLTEAAPVTHTMPLWQERRPGSIGPLLPSTEGRVVDVESGLDCEPGEPGEVWIRGPQVMGGYLDDPEATARTVDAEGWLHTGDIGTVDADGCWKIVDRLKELIKYKGYQVAPAALEAVLLTHPEVVDACVIPIDDEEAGELPKAYVVTRSEVDPDALMAFVAASVAPHERVRAVEFTHEIPKSPSGKLLRRVLVERERARTRVT